MNFVDDARDVLFADPADMDSPEFTLDLHIEYAEFNLQCAISHLDDLLRQKAEAAEQKAAEDAHFDAQYAEYCEIQDGKIVIESDNADKVIQREIACRYLEENPEAFTKVVATEGSYAFGEIHLCTAEGQRLGVVSSAEVSSEA